MDDILYDYKVSEYEYNRDFSRLTDIMSKDTIEYFRRRYYDKSVELAKDLSSYLLVECETLAAPFIFNHKDVNHMIKIPDAMTGNLVYVTVFKHGVVLLGEGIIDLLHSNRIIRTKLYVQSIASANSSLVINEDSYWFDDEGNKIFPGLNYLANYSIKR